MEFVSTSTSTHIYAILILIGIISYNYYTVQTQKEFILLARRLKKLTPYFHGMNFVVAYTGAILSAFTWNLSPLVIFMIPLSLFLMITEIKRYKKMRVIKLNETQKQEEFKTFAKKIYTMQLVSIIVVFVVVTVFK